VMWENLIITMSHKFCKRAGAALKKSKKGRKP
jgi:hypothetical protein